MTDPLSEPEMEIIIADLLRIYGIDFTNYARPSLYRRINRIYQLDKFSNCTQFQSQLCTDTDYLRRFTEEITVNLTEMFRDPEFFKTLSTQILPALETVPLIKIWIAGCSSGEEVVSIAILLKELHLLDKSMIHATDLNQTMLESARKGIFPLQHMKQYSQNYISSGGRLDFSAYYTTGSGYARFDQHLLERVVFKPHNLATDSVLTKYNLIICRNVLIYFNRNLQSSTLLLFDRSVDNHGYLALGARETLRFSPLAARYRQPAGEQKIWRKSS